MAAATGLKVRVNVDFPIKVAQALDKYSASKGVSNAKMVLRAVIAMLEKRGKLNKDASDSDEESDGNNKSKTKLK